MKKALITIAVGALFSISVFAQEVACDVGTAKPITGEAGQFVVKGFTPKCSNNVTAKVDDKETYINIAAASMKGNEVFIANTDGGKVVPATGVDCGKACTDTNVDEGLAEADTLGSSGS